MSLEEVAMVRRIELHSGAAVHVTILPNSTNVVDVELSARPLPVRTGDFIGAAFLTKHDNMRVLAKIVRCRLTRPQMTLSEFVPGVPYAFSVNNELYESPEVTRIPPCTVQFRVEASPVAVIVLKPAVRYRGTVALTTRDGELLARKQIDGDRVNLPIGGIERGEYALHAWGPGWSTKTRIAEIGTRERPTFVLQTHMTATKHVVISGQDAGQDIDAMTFRGVDLISLSALASAPGPAAAWSEGTLTIQPTPEELPCPVVLLDEASNSVRGCLLTMGGPDRIEVAWKIRRRSVVLRGMGRLLSRFSDHYFRLQVKVTIAGWPPAWATSRVLSRGDIESANGHPQVVVDEANEYRLDVIDSRTGRRVTELDLETLVRDR